MPVLDAFYRRYRGKGLRVLAVSVDDPFAEATVRQFMAPYALPLALLHDTHALNYGKISRIPSSFLIDRRGYCGGAAGSANLQTTPATWNGW
jgi:peroxiredoxin